MPIYCFYAFFDFSIATLNFLWYKNYRGGNPMNNEEKKDIEVITGDGKDLDISPVYDHIKSNIVHDNDGKKKDIVIPKGNQKKGNDQ